MSTLGQEQGSEHVSRHECNAIRQLAADGRGAKDIAFMLERKEQTVSTHLTGDCTHGEQFGNVDVDKALRTARVAYTAHDYGRLEKCALAILSAARRAKSESHGGA